MTSTTISTIQGAIQDLFAIFAVPTYLLASFIARAVLSRPRTHAVSMGACISVPDAMRKGAPAAAGDSWTLSCAGPCEFCMLIIIGLCAHWKASEWTSSEVL